MSFGKLKPGETSGEEVLTSTLRRPSIGSVAVSFLASQKTQSSPRFSRSRRESQGRAGANQDGLRGAGGMCSRSPSERPGFKIGTSARGFHPLESRLQLGRRRSQKTSPVGRITARPSRSCRAFCQFACVSNHLVLFAARFPQIG